MSVTLSNSFSWELGKLIELFYDFLSLLSCRLVTFKFIPAEQGCAHRTNLLHTPRNLTHDKRHGRAICLCYAVA